MIDAGPVFVIERSAPCGVAQVTFVRTVWLWLFDVFVSVCAPETVARFWMTDGVQVSVAAGMLNARFTVRL